MSAMRFGICCDEDRFKLAAEMGFSYVETAFNKLASMDEREYKKFIESLNASGLKSEACNCFFTFDIKLIGENADYAFLNSYVNKGMEHAAEAGCRVAVIGNGGREAYSRSV